MRYLIDINVTWNTGIDSHYRETLEAENIPDLKEKFTDYIIRKASRMARFFLLNNCWYF